MRHVAPCQPSPPASNSRTLYRDVPAVHATLGVDVGNCVGAGEGIELGAELGSADGTCVGKTDGGDVGAAVGSAVG